MSILTATHLTKFFGADEVFSDLSLAIPQGAKIAIVGPNGAGKTTLLKILIGLDSPSEGNIHLAKGTRLGYLPQNPTLEGQHSVHQEMLKVFEALLAKERDLIALEHQLASDPDPTLLERYGRLQAEFEAAGGYTYELQIEQVLGGLGFNKAWYEHPLGQLSGGQKTRVLLARLLLEAPDLLVLDEPTNHLDINAIEWLENYLRAFEGAVLMVSHDRYFMDNVVKIIWELDWGEVESYNGNYSHYLRQRGERHERRLKDYEAQQAFIAKEMDFIQRNIAGQNTAQAKGRRRRLERLMSGTDRHNKAVQEAWLKRKPPKRRSMKVHLQASSRTGDQVLKTFGLAVGYETPLFSVPDLLLLRGEVAAIIGPNGAGKSTFLKTILGQLTALQGESEWGSQVKIGYFAQAHEDLQLDKTILDEILSVKDMLISEARSYLATYLFTADDVFRPISTLSGGERGRLALAKLALAGANVLLLDEPTNHLDIASQEVLQDVLSDFDGTILLISHDRYLVEALATQIWHVQPSGMTLFKGGYALYQESRRQAEAAQTNSQAETKKAALGATNTPKPKAPPKHGLTPYQLEKKLKALEEEVHQLEQALASTLADLDAASLQGHLDQVTRLGQQYNQQEAALNAALEAWATLADGG
jgi:ATP-binding cassette subfamily F protein 3